MFCTSTGLRCCNTGASQGAPTLGPVQVCESHKDIARALSVWTEYPSSDQPPEQCFRAKGGGRGKLQQFFTPLRPGWQPEPASGRAAGHQGGPAQAAQQASARVTGDATSPADGSAGPNADVGTAAAPATGGDIIAERQAVGQAMHKAGSPCISTAVAKRKGAGSDDIAAGPAASKQHRAMGATAFHGTEAAGKPVLLGTPVRADRAISTIYISALLALL